MIPADRRLDESAEELYDEAPCGYLSTAPDGTIVRVNGTFLRWTGYTREQLVGARRFQDLLTAGGRIYHETHYAPLLRMQGTVREIALEIVRADGRRLPVLVNAVLKSSPEGEPQLVRTTVFDATDRQRYERELLAARDRERVARQRADTLQRITAGIAAAPDVTAIARAVVAELVAALGADRAGVATQDPASDAVRVVADHGEPRAGDLAPDSGARFDEGEAGVRGALARLPLGRGGSLWIAFDDPRTLHPEERALLRACAEQTALALARPRLYEQSRDVAHVLQQSLLAGTPPRDPRFAVATAYHAALEHLEVGGDWYDAFALGGDRLGIAVGDVVGRGIDAASAMGQLRSAVRALAGAELAPGEVLGHLDTFVEQFPAARYATLLYAEIDLATGTVCAASAGHLPAVLIRGGEAAPELFMEGRSAPLGVAAAGGRPQAAFTLAPGEGFLLYTDGLVERRDEVIDDGIARLLEVVRRHAGASPSALVGALPGALLEEGAGEDDVCLLAFRLLGT